jgi:hypothetical protein
MRTKKFKRNIENFTCEHCGAEVRGNGYTNHCPRCLWSKHVDINPGDRASRCGGLMEPIEIQLKNGDYIILHRCEKCGFEKRNKTVREDDLDVIITLSANN